MLTVTKIPLHDATTHYQSVADEVNAAVLRVLESGKYLGAKEIKGFEAEFAEFCGVSHTVTTANAADALRLALSAVDVGPGAEVITVSHNFVAATEAIAQLGAVPKFVDVDPNTATLDPSKLEAAVTDRTAAIVPAHLYGRPADMNPIMDIAGRYGIPVIEDATHSPGAFYNGSRVGSLGDLACFGFYPTANLGAAGDGGAVTTNVPELAKRVRQLAHHGSDGDFEHRTLGWSSRMHEIQASILRIKLRSLDGCNDARRSLATKYQRAISAHAAPGVRAPVPSNGESLDSSVYHLFVIRAEQRDFLRTELAFRGIATGIHYPAPIHRQPAFTDRYAAPSLVATEAWSSSCLSLPLFPGLNGADVETVVSSIAEISLTAADNKPDEKA